MCGVEVKSQETLRGHATVTGNFSASTMDAESGDKGMDARPWDESGAK